jgi:hypothetical protein
MTDDAANSGETLEVLEDVDLPEEPDPAVELFEFLRAVHVMKLYCAGNGVVLSPAARRALAAVAPIEQSLEVVEKRPVYRPRQSSSLVDDLEAAMTAHALLSKAVAPATPDSIRYTRPPRKIREFYERQRLLFFLLLVAVIAVLGYAVTLVSSSIYEEPQHRMERVSGQIERFDEHLDQLQALEVDVTNRDVEFERLLAELERRNIALERSVNHLTDPLSESWPAESIQIILIQLSENPLDVRAAAESVRAATVAVRDAIASQSLSPRWRDMLFQQLRILFAAILGAAFYTLYTAHMYVVNRTFDRAYSTHYVVRFVLGIVAGTVLANFGEYLLVGEVGSGTEKPAVVLAQTVFALIGGYSADAVNAIFTRFAETLTTMVRGDSRREVKAETQAAKAEAKVETFQAKQHAVAKLQQILKVAVLSGAPDDVIAILQAEIDALASDAVS